MIDKTHTGAVGIPMLRLGSRGFWVAQILGWSGIYLVFFFPMRETALASGATMGELVFVNIFGAVLAIVISTGLGAIYLRISDKFLHGIRSVAMVFLLCATGALLMAMITALGSWSSGIGPWFPEGVNERVFFPVYLFVQGMTLFGTWSAMFLVALLVERVQIERERAIIASALVNEAQLNVLRSQLNPHFLFNALNSVIGLIGEDSKRADQMVRDIASLLRRALDDTNNSNLKVADEMEFVSLYLRCQKVRFEEQLQITVQVDDSLMEMPFPGMLLHPLVENAVKHGSRKGGVLHIQITGRQEGHSIVFEVRNTGELADDSRETFSGTGTGVKTVRERISVMYPISGSFSMEEEEGQVLATLRLDPEEGRAT